MSDIQRLIIGYIPKGCSAWDLVDKSLQQDENLVNLIGEEAP